MRMTILLLPVWLGAVVCGTAVAQGAVQSAASAAAPSGATGLCNDGTFTFSPQRKGSCRGKQGIAEWFASGRERSPETEVPTAASAPTLPRPQDAEIAIKSGESVDLDPVYWVEGCTSLLNAIVGVDFLDGPAGITLSVRREDVIPRGRGCTNKVNGGVIVASVKDVANPVRGTLKYRVRYNTQGGTRQSTHSAQIALYP